MKYGVHMSMPSRLDKSSSISPRKIYTVSRTYDSISFPSKNNVYFAKFKSFLDDQINSKDLQQIFIFIPDL